MPWIPLASPSSHAISRRRSIRSGRIAPHLDDKSLVTLALALESVGRQGDAIDMLMKANPHGTDPIGVLAGRLKRRWLVEHKRSDAEQALSLYAPGTRAGRDEAGYGAGLLPRDQLRLHGARVRQRRRGMPRVRPTGADALRAGVG